MTDLINLSHLETEMTFKNYLQILVLQRYGGIWIDASIMLTENMTWLSDIKNGKFVNNRIDSPQVVMFY